MSKIITIKRKEATTNDPTFLRQRCRSKSFK